MFCKTIALSCLVAAALVFTGCEAQERKAAPPQTATDTNRQEFTVKGLLKEIKPNGKTAVIAHEEIPDYMPAMTMDLDVKDKRELQEVKPGDYISFRMVVTSDDGWIENIRKLPPPAPTNASERILLPGTNATNQVSFRRAPMVEPLEVGQTIPDYKFTNEFGKPISLADYKGKALGLTFIFTRCPFPTFCPKMMQNFQAAQAKLKALPNAPTNWTLLALTIDPEWDTPERLRKWAENYNYDTNRWQLGTGDLWNLDAISEQFGLTFYRETPNALPNHNLRTAVIDANGRLQKVFIGNEWNTDEFVSEMVQAAKVK
jgi:protein SCO1